MKKTIMFTVIVVVSMLLCGCAANFAGKTPVSSDVEFITSNEAFSKDQYELKGMIVVQRHELFFDVFGMVKAPNPTLEEVLTDNIANELTEKAKELDANAIMDMEIVSFCYYPGCLGLFPLPLGRGSVTIQAKAIELNR